MGLLKKVLRERRRGRRDFGPPMGRPRMVPNIPAPIPPLEPFERLPFDDPRNDFMSIQRIEDVGVPGITPIEPVMPPPIPLPIPPILPQPIMQQPQPPQTGGIPVTGGGPLGSGILPIADLPASPAPPPTNIGIQIPDNPVGGITAVPQEPIELETGPVTIGGPKDLGGVGPAPVLAGNNPPPAPFATINQPVQPIVPTNEPIDPANSLQKMPVPPKREDFMSIGGPGGGLPNVSQVSTIGREIAVPGTGTPPPQTGLTAAELLELSDEELRKYIPRSSIGNMYTSYDNTPSPEEFREQLQRELNPSPEDARMQLGGPRRYNLLYENPLVGRQPPIDRRPDIRPIDTPVDEFVPPITDPVIQPAVTDPTAPTEPVTTPTDTTTPTEVPVAPIDPVLMQQSASEVISDPLLRSLYFGTADSPGFYNQLQQAGSNLIGSDVPLQQTAGLTPLELLARQQAVAGLGGFEPFLQQNRNLVNQAIQQSRRAEQLQDPYYTQAEEIYKDTMGAYDPSMTQQFYNPYEDAVVQQTIEDVIKAGDKQDIAARAREISSGAFGGSRARLGAEERRQDLGEGLAKALSGIRSQGFQSAQATGLGEFARQQQAKRTGAQGLMGIGVGRGSAASNLGQQLAGFGGQLTGLGRTQEELRRGQRGELAGYGGIGRGIAETGLSRIYDQMLAQQYRPMQTLQQIGGMLPGYQASSSRIDSQYGMPTDPAAAGLGAAFSAYGAVAPRQGSG